MGRRPAVRKTDPELVSKSAGHPAFETERMGADGLDLLEAVYDTLPDPVIIAGRDQRIVSWNSKAREVFGYEGDELTGMSTDTLFVRMEFDNRLAGQGDGKTKAHSGQANQVECRRRNGSRFVGTLTTNRVLDRQGNVAGELNLIHDLSEFEAVQADQLRMMSVLTEALSVIKEGFVVYDDQDRLVMCNEAYKKIYSTSAAAIVPGKRFEDILRHGLALGQYPEAGETPESQETWLEKRLATHRAPDGAMVQAIDGNRWLQIEERRTRDNYRVGIRTEITNHVRMKSETERLGRILEAISEEVYLIDPDTFEVRLTNKKARETHELDEAGTGTLYFDQINSPGDGSTLRDKLAPLRAHLTDLVTYQGVQSRKGKGSYPCHVRVEHYHDHEGAALIASVEDISKLVEMEELLSRSEKEFESLICQLPDAITRAEPDTTLNYINPFYANLVGKTAQELIGRKFETLIPENEREAAMAHIKSLTPDNPIKTFEQQTISHDGRQFIYLWSNLMQFEDGEPVELISIGRDITEQRRAQERIAQQSRELALQNQALEQFTGIVSHDLKAPLRQIRAFAEMISADLEVGEFDRVAEYSGHLTDKAGRLEKMINRLLDYSREAYRKLDLQQFRLNDAIKAARLNLASQISETNAKIAADVSIVIRADFRLTVQLLQNLLANAMKYTAPGISPEIRIDARIEGDKCIVTVSDNGIGVGADHSERIFEAFYRLHKDESVYEGAGLGLALCKRIAKSHDGDIRVDRSHSPGTRFIVTLGGQFRTGSRRLHA